MNQGKQLGNFKQSREQKEGEEKKSYSATELLKEQYEVKKKYNKLCSSFELSDNVQWPVSEIETSEYAQQVFAFEVRDPKDIYDIIVNKKEIDTLYWTQMISKLQIWIILIFFSLIGQCLCCCQIFCVPQLKILRRCCQIDFNKESDTTTEKNIYFFLIVIFGGLIFFFGGSVFMASDIQISQTQLQCTILWSQKILLGVDAKNSTSILTEYYEDNQAEDSVTPQGGTIFNDSQQSTWEAKYGGIDILRFQFKQLSSFFQTIQDLESVQQIKDIKIQPLNEEFKQVSQKIPEFYNQHRVKNIRIVIQYRLIIINILLIDFTTYFLSQINFYFEINKEFYVQYYNQKKLHLNSLRKQTEQNFIKRILVNRFYQFNNYIDN